MADVPAFDIPRGTFDPSFVTEEPAVYPNLAGLSPPSLKRSQPAPPPPVGYDRVTKQLYVNGSTFHEDDHQSAVESQSYLGQPLTEMPANFKALSPDAYKQYLGRILDPSLGRLIKKNIGIGVDVSQQLAGSALKFVGAEETGQAIVDQQTEDLRFNQPYQRTFTEDALGSPGGAGEWFVANAAQLAPLMIEMMLASFVGGFAGGGVALAGGVRGATKGIGLLTKAGRKRTAVLARQAMRKQAKGEVLERGSAHHTALRTVGRAHGARLGALAASYGVGVGDIYQEVSEAGNYDSAIQARLATALFAVPYAYAELLPAQLALTQAFKAAGKGFKAGGRLKRGTKGLVVGGGVEGGTEGFQEVLALGASGELDFSDPEVQNRLINAVAAGAGVGAPLGGLANAIGKTPGQPEIDPKPKVDPDEPEANMLDPEDTASIVAPGLVPGLAPAGSFEDLLPRAADAENKQRDKENAQAAAEAEAAAIAEFDVVRDDIIFDSPAQAGSFEDLLPRAADAENARFDEARSVQDLREDQIVDDDTAARFAADDAARATRFAADDAARATRAVEDDAARTVGPDVVFDDRAEFDADMAAKGVALDADIAARGVDLDADIAARGVDLDADIAARTAELNEGGFDPAESEAVRTAESEAAMAVRTAESEAAMAVRTADPDTSMIDVPGKRGKVRSVTVRKAMEDAEQEVISQEALMACLSGVK
jgi:hypothetical protein